MQLKQIKGQSSVTVTLTKPEQAILAKAEGVLDMLAKVPCDQQAAAAKALESIKELAAAFADEGETE
jgi:anaerobic glycerol-3-phosphate dehydrogenase